MATQAVDVFYSMCSNPLIRQCEEHCESPCSLPGEDKCFLRMRNIRIGQEIGINAIPNYRMSATSKRVLE